MLVALRNVHAPYSIANIHAKHCIGDAGDQKGMRTIGPYTRLISPNEA
jgi:hypothetical protein